MPKRKLTDADVRGIRYSRNAEGASLAWLKWVYGVSEAQISRVARGLQGKCKVAKRPRRVKPTDATQHPTFDPSNPTTNSNPREDSPLFPV